MAENNEVKGKKVLVTGGAGFIGAHLVDSLVNRDYEVIVIDDLSTGKQERINEKAKFIQLDLLQQEKLESIFEQEKPEIVIHAAGNILLRESFDNPIHDAKINTLGTISVLEACKKNNVKKIIYTSTGGARFGKPEYMPVDEKHPLHPVSPYGISKHNAEHYVEAYAKLYGIEYLIFCFGNVYGPRDDPDLERVVTIFAHKLLNQEQPTILGDGTQTRDFVYVKDLVEFIVDSIHKNPEHKLFHLANGEQVSVNQILQELKDLIGTDIDPKYSPGVKGELKDILLDPSLAKEELGWNPKYTLRQGLKEIVDYMKSIK